MAMAALITSGSCLTAAFAPSVDVQTKWAKRTYLSKAGLCSGRLGNAAFIHQQLCPAKVSAFRQGSIRAWRRQSLASPVAAITAVGTGGNGEPEERPPPNEFLDDPAVGRKSETGRYLGRKEKTVTVVIDGKLLTEGALKAGEAVKQNVWPPNKHWIPFLVAPAALLFAMVAARVQQLKSAPITPSVTSSVSMPLPPRGSSPELKVVGVLGSLPGAGMRMEVATNSTSQDGGARGVDKEGFSASEKMESGAVETVYPESISQPKIGAGKQQRWVDGALARNDAQSGENDGRGQQGRDKPKAITELTDIDFYEHLQKEAEIEAKLRRTQGFPMKDDSQFGLFDEEERKVMQELVESGTLDAETQKRLEELLAQEEGNSKMKGAAQRAMGKRVRKKKAAGRKSPISDEEIKELEEAAATGLLAEDVQKDLEAFLKEEKEYRKKLEEEDKYDDDEYDASEYMDEEEDPELEAMIKAMVESGEFEVPKEGDYDEEEDYAEFAQEDDEYNEDDDDETYEAGDFFTKENQTQSSEKTGGGSKDKEKGGPASDADKKEKKGGGENKRVRGLRELTDKLGLTVRAGESVTNWEAELKKKNLARIGPFDFGNVSKKDAGNGAPASREAAEAVPSDEAIIQSVEAISTERRTHRAEASEQAQDLRFTGAPQEVSEQSREAEWSEAAAGSRGDAAAEGSSRDAVWPGEAGATVQIAAAESRRGRGDGQEQTEGEIVFRVVEAEEPTSSGPGSSSDQAAASATHEASPPSSSSTDTPSSSGGSAASDGAASTSDADASAGSVGPEISLAGADVTPLVELLKQNEGDENYALKTSWGTYADMSPLKRKWQVWVDRQMNTIRLKGAKVEIIDSREVKFSGKEPAMEGQRHYIYQVLYRGKRYALKMPKRAEDRGNQHLLVEEAVNLAAVQGANVIALQGVVRDLGSLPIYRLGRAAGPLLTSEQLAQGLENGSIEELQSCIMPDGSKVTVKSTVAEESGERAPNVHGILMEYAEGSNLAAQVEKAAAEHKMNVDEAWHVFRQLAMGLGEIHAGRLAHNNVDLSNVLLVRDEAQASGVRCCWTGLSLAKKTDNSGNVRLTPEERLGRLMRQDDYYQAPELTDPSAAVLYNGFKADTYALGKAFLLLVGDEYEKQAGVNPEALADMDQMFGMTLQPEPENRATSVEVMEFTRQKELEALERWREKEDKRLEEMARAGLPKTQEELELEKMLDEDPKELRQAEEEAFQALVEEMRKRQAAEAEKSGEQGPSGGDRKGAGRTAPEVATNGTK